MRKIIYGINLTADGCCDHTAFSGGDELHEYFTNLLRGVDLVVYGRKTYELMVPFWPQVAREQSESEAVNEFARVFSAIDRVVFSTTLTSADDHTKIVRGNLRDEILKLKQAPGKNISIGGVDLPAQLIALGLVDEFYFLVHPVMAGEGRRLLEGANLQEQLQLKPAGSEVLASGCVALHYRKQDA